ncbi:MAG: hypothetical protein DI630_16955 [Gordonia sp. (in: high G+C Gram-positive bacteria)]|nr:MAG: hypothetical protein DI630_16955 [Gordonia sp. (in: high G+C Gram-positive bacteria)]
MTVAFDAVGAGNGTSGSTGGQTMSWSHTGAGADLVVLVAVTAAKSISYGVGGTRTCTYGGVAMTSLGVQATANGNGWQEVFGLVGAPTGPQTVTWSSNQSASSAVFIGQSVSYNGVSGFGTLVGASGTSATPTVTVPSTVTNMVAAFMQAAANMSAPTQTQRSLNNTGPRLSIQDAPGAASVTFAATISSNSWGATGVSLINASTPIANSDTGTTSDAGTVFANRPESDSTSTTETATVAAQLPSTDAGLSAESQRVAVTSADAAVAVEGNAVNVPRPSTDTAASTEAAAITAKTVAVDTATAVDTGTTASKNPSADTASPTDAGTVKAFIKSGDTSVWLEAAGALTAASDTDTAVATDAGGVILPGYSPVPKRTWKIPAADRVTVMDRESRTWRVPRGEHSYKPAPGTAPYTIPFTLTA